MIDQIESVFSPASVHGRGKRAGINHALDHRVVALGLAAADGSNLRVVQGEFFDEDSQQAIRKTGDTADADRFALEILYRANFLARDDDVGKTHQRGRDQSRISAGRHAGQSRVRGTVKKLYFIGAQRGQVDVRAAANHHMFDGDAIFFEKIV